MKTPLNGDHYRKGASAYANEELERLRAENHHLRRLLSEHGISITASPVKQTEAPVPTSLQPSDGNLTSSSTAEEKIAQFRRLFRGRDDVYAIRWRGKDGKTGYSPASLKNLDKRDAQGRPERTFLPLTHEAVQNHLTGREIIGVYPLLPDETCWFLAADFDKEGCEFLQPTVQVDPERTRFITSHHATGELSLFHHKEHELVVVHLLHGLRSRPVDLRAYPVILGVGVDAEFDGVAGGA